MSALISVSVTNLDFYTSWRRQVYNMTREQTYIQLRECSSITSVHFSRLWTPHPPPLHQRNQQGSRPPTPLYFADVILEHIARVLILFRGLFLKIFSEITNSFRNNKSSTSLKTYLINLIVNLASKCDDHNYLLL